MQKQAIDNRLQHFYSNTNKTSYCWHWKGPLDYDGNAVVETPHGEIKAIEFLYETMYDQRPSSIKLKLECRDIRCVNPDHIVVHDGVNVPITLTNRIIPIHKPSRPPHYRYKRSVEDCTKLFWKNVRKTDGCWLWQGTVSNKYGQFNMDINGKQVLAHRVSFLMAGGTIPDGFEVDHLCRNTLCVNPKHLEAVTHLENIRRALPYRNKIYKNYELGGYCINGHEYTEESLCFYTDKKSGRKYGSCRTCSRESAQRNK